MTIVDALNNFNLPREVLAGRIGLFLLIKLQSQIVKNCRARGFSDSLKFTMIIPVRCFTCGKVKRFADGCVDAASFEGACRLLQVIGNKWDSYLDLLQADYSEG